MIDPQLEASGTPVQRTGTRDRADMPAPGDTGRTFTLGSPRQRSQPPPSSPPDRFDRSPSGSGYASDGRFQGSGAGESTSTRRALEVELSLQARPRRRLGGAKARLQTVLDRICGVVSVHKHVHKRSRI
ncbi:hypothetical protein AK812_SmicGene47759 [Symbiodinium microadriaticum]|uniref:Uncharacterized protein n=1 Tax=Symbiodinium microadriaticum TaxID=2951 RepID=A0A1Q9BRF0_SYMMI|nr:hypothetical protein AK812_SmicGene47759 [Symbiodinium microadriaticum]